MHAVLFQRADQQSLAKQAGSIYDPRFRPLRYTTMRSTFRGIAFLIGCLTMEPGPGQGRCRRPEGLALMRFRRNGIAIGRRQCRLCPEARELFGCLVGQRRMRPSLVVFDSPARDFAARIPEIPEPACVQTFIAEAPVEAFDMPVGPR